MTATARIPQTVLDAYTTLYPHLAALAAQAACGEHLATLAFARSACRLAVPTGLTIAELAALDGIAAGQGWPTPERDTWHTTQAAWWTTLTDEERADWLRIAPTPETAWTVHQQRAAPYIGEPLLRQFDPPDEAA
jgi:hypothetical protein